MDLHAVVGQVKGHVGGVKEVIRKELLDHILLIAQTDDKLIISELGVMCQRIGFSPISIIGFGFKWLSSLILVPNPPARITTFIFSLQIPWYFRLLLQRRSIRFPLR